MTASRYRGSLGVWLLLLAYASLYPFFSLRPPPSDWLREFFSFSPRYLVRSDIAFNVIAYIPLGTLGCLYFGNLPKTRRVGIELAGRYAFGEAHSVYANYAYTRATFESEAEIFSVLEDIGIENETEPGDLIPLVPLQQFKAGVNLRFALPVSKYMRPRTVRPTTVPEFPFTYKSTVDPVAVQITPYDNLDRLRKRLYPTFVWNEIEDLRTAHHYVSASGGEQ